MPTAVTLGGEPRTIQPRVLLIAENASYRFGGEAVLPLHYFRVLRRRGVPVWMILNERNRAELAGKLPPEDMNQLLFVPDSPGVRLLVRIGQHLPASAAAFTVGQLMEVIDQRRSVKLARHHAKELRFTIVHQPTPVSPKHVSILQSHGRGGLGVPVVMGPMNGGITYPKAFREREPLMDRIVVTIGRMFAGIVHPLFPGKLRAETLMVANTRTRAALPRGVRGKIEQVVENGVDLAMYQGVSRTMERDPNSPVRLVFAGRLVRFKGVDLLLRAFARAHPQVKLHLDILGDGPMRHEWQRSAAALKIEQSVSFHGWMSPQDCAEKMKAADIFVLPSLRESGGAVVLEAMAMRLPVIAANWGGPADYIDPSCGILVDVETPEQFVTAFAQALVELAHSPQRCRAMGEAGYQKVLREYDWERKVDRVLEIYREAMLRGGVATVQQTRVPEPDAVPVAS